MNCRIKCKIKTLKLSKENKGENLWELGLGEQFLDLIPETRSLKKTQYIGLY